MSKAGTDTSAYPRIRFGGSDAVVATLASRDLSLGLSAMLDRDVPASADASLDRTEIIVDLSDRAESAHPERPPLEDDNYEVSRDTNSIAIR